MESVSFGCFLIIFFGFAALLAAPIALAITDMIARRQEGVVPSERRPTAVVIGVLSFILLMLAACIGLLFWKPTY
jgi:hypothetical protein